MMEQGTGSESIPASGSVDKTRILNIKPLRCLVPMFPPSPDSSAFSSPQSASFVCAPPTGPFPPGLSAFYPHFFSNPQPTPMPGPYGVNETIQSPVPLNSFRSPPIPRSKASNGHAKGSRKKSRAGVAVDEEGSDSLDQNEQSFGVESEDTSGLGRGSQRTTRSGRTVKTSNEVDVEALVNSFFSALDLSVFTFSKRDDGGMDYVRYILMVFDFMRRKLTQLEDTKGITRPDLKAGATLLAKEIRTNARKRVGPVPGVEVGDIFYFRMEMCVVGLHAPSMAGIDYLSTKVSANEDALAVSIVSSDGYGDNDEEGDVLIYSGQGGNMNRTDKDMSDQKLERGNLALEKSLHKGNDIRVIRGLKDFCNPLGKIYVYDGLYNIRESWVDKGKQGHNVFKYKLVRIKDQPEAFTLWKSIQLWKESISSRAGVILPDLTSGVENFAVSLVNDVDSEKGPAYFTYFPSLKYGKPFSSPQPSPSCSCRGGCQAGDANCHCFEMNNRSLPYTSNGIVLRINSLIYECGPSCLCPLSCRYRISQAGLKFRLEVFRTKDRGWGLRSWDPIRAGSFICEYAGEVIDESTMDNFGSENEDDYIFDATRSYDPPESMRTISSESPKIPFPLVISSKNIGNVARFMNHSCDPNVYWQPVLRENNNESYLYIAFFAIGHIPPMKELTYHYGTVPSENVEQRKKCLCGSSKCRGYYN